jgi:hypothetical protein
LKEEIIYQNSSMENKKKLLKTLKSLRNKIFFFAILFLVSCLVLCTFAWLNFISEEINWGYLLLQLVFIVIMFFSTSQVKKKFLQLNVIKADFIQKTDKRLYLEYCRIQDEMKKLEEENERGSYH